MRWYIVGCHADSQDREILVVQAASQREAERKALRTVRVAYERKADDCYLDFLIDVGSIDQPEPRLRYNCA